MPYAKGTSGNPGGKPKSNKQFKDALQIAIKRTEGDKTMLAKLAEALVDKAVSGDVQAIREVADRLDGKPHQTSEITHIRARAAELSDDELAGYLSGGSSEGIAETPSDPSKLN